MPEGGGEEVTSWNQVHLYDPVFSHFHQKILRHLLKSKFHCRVLRNVAVTEPDEKSVHFHIPYRIGPFQYYYLVYASFSE
jgi:hypothetical protein